MLKDDSVIPTFSFSELQKMVHGFSEGPDGEIYEKYGFGLYKGDDYALCDLEVNKSVAWRQDRTFWDPGKTVQNETGQAELFGFTQTDPRACVHNVMDCQTCDNSDDFAYRLKEHRIMTEDK